MAARTLLLSIRPEHADKIFSGDKTMELRRTRPKVGSGDWVLVYVSSPRRELVGAFEVSGLTEATPHMLWHKAKGEAAVTRDQFTDYFADASRAFGIGVARAATFTVPITLQQLRTYLPGFHPPQSYRYLADTDLARIGIGRRYRGQSVNRSRAALAVLAHLGGDHTPSWL